jgi:tetratricopeptide (TPR) repeat protein
MTGRRLAFLLAVGFGLAAPTVSRAADFRAAAGDAYRSGRYDPGIRALRTEIAKLPPGPSAARAEALYLVGRLELRKAELVTELGRAGRRHAADHLARLAAGPTPLRRVGYFLGLARLESGESAAAAAAFRQAVKAIPPTATGEDLVIRQLAELRLRAPRDLTAPPTADPRVAAEAGFLLATVGRDPARGLAVADAALVEAARAGGQPSASVVRATAGARLAAGRIDEALALLEGSEPHLPASTEKSGPVHQVEYYDVVVLRLLAEATARAAARDLALAAEIAEAPLLREAALFAGARARLLVGDAKGALTALGPLAAPATLGPAGAARVKAQAGRARAALREKAGAARLWQEALAEAGNDPDALGELAEALAEAHARGEADVKLVQALLARAGAVADGSPRRPPQALTLGLVALAAAAGGDPATLVAQLERARDKSAKNRLDANDPVFLARLAQAEVRARLFSEALEIYFEMAKAYPEVRQVQEALQGVYAAEQVAGGEVRIN